MSDNWVVQNLENALEVWNDKLSEIWQLITQSPQTFKGGSIWSIICSIHGALQAIGYALLVLFFVVGVMRTCGSFAEVKKPEHAGKLFVRFAIAKGIITYGMELMLAFLAAGMSVTALAVGTALAGAVTNLGLGLSVCLLRKRHCAVADRDEFCRKCLLLLAACGVLAVFVRDGELSYTGTGLLMLLFVLFVMMSIVFQHKFTYGDTIKAVSTSEKHPSPQLAAQEYGYTAHTMAFPVMNVRNALTNLAGVAGGLALLAGGAQALLYSATTLANLTGTIQALWAATLISFGFCIPLLVEALNHPLGSVWKWFSVRCRYYPPDSLPIQLLNSAILNLTLALPISSLMYRHKLPVGAQFRSYEVPVCAAMALVLLLPPLCRHKLKRGQGWMCLALYFAYLAAALLLPRAGA